MKKRENREIGRALRHSRRGMTLVEIMVVIAIIGILSSAISFGVFTYLKRAKVRTCEAQLRKIANTLTTYYALEDDFPSDLTDLTSSDAGGKWLKPKDLKDPWKVDILYAYPSSRGEAEFDLCSAGPDKQEGTEDDICYNE